MTSLDLLELAREGSPVVVLVELGRPPRARPIGLAGSHGPLGRYVATLGGGRYAAEFESEDVIAWAGRLVVEEGAL